MPPQCLRQASLLGDFGGWEPPAVPVEGQSPASGGHRRSGRLWAAFLVSAPWPAWGTVPGLRVCCCRGDRPRGAPARLPIGSWPCSARGGRGHGAAGGRRGRPASFQHRERRPQKGLRRPGYHAHLALGPSPPPLFALLGKGRGSTCATPKLPPAAAPRQPPGARRPDRAHCGASLPPCRSSPPPPPVRLGLAGTAQSPGAG